MELDSIDVEKFKPLDKIRSLLEVEPVFVLSKVILEDSGFSHTENDH